MDGGESAHSSKKDFIHTGEIGLIKADSSMQRTNQKIVKFF